MQSPPTVSVIIVTYNSAAFVSECLASIPRSPAVSGIEVIAVDNASSDDSLGAIRRGYPGATVIANPSNTGFGPGTNAGFAASTGEFLLLLNPDTILKDGALESMLEFACKHPDAGAVGPRILNADGTLQRTGVSAPSLWNLFSDTLFLDAAFPRSRIFGRHRRLFDDPEMAAEVECLQGSCLLIRRKAVGNRLFDPAYFLYFEETDLCTRLRGEGWKVMYYPGASIVHVGGSGARHYDRERIVHYHESYVTYLRKHFSPVRRLLFQALLIARGLLRCGILAVGAAISEKRRRGMSDRAGGYLRAVSRLAGFGE